MATDREISQDTLDEAESKLRLDVLAQAKGDPQRELSEDDYRTLVDGLEYAEAAGRSESRTYETAALLAELQGRDNPFSNARLRQAFDSRREHEGQRTDQYREFEEDDRHVHNTVERDIERERQRQNDRTLKELEQEQEGTEEERDEPGAIVPDLPDPDASNDDPEADAKRMPAHVAEQFRQGRGGRWYYKDGKDRDDVAFRDNADQLSTTRDDASIAHALVAVADSRNWKAINTKGTYEFRREIWLEASARGLDVEGYKPNERDLADLDKRKTEMERRTNHIEDGTLQERADASVSDESASGVPVGADQPQRPADKQVDRLAGTILDHGKAPYQHNPDNRDSYFIELENADGSKHTQWGVDLERAIEDSKAGTGDTIKLEDQGTNPVTVKTPTYDSRGQKTGTKEIETFRRTWSVHAEAIREKTPEALSRENPELANEAAWMQAADQKIGARLPDEHRNEFNARVREQMADRVETGQRAPELRIRETSTRESEPIEPERKPSDPTR